MVIVDSPLSAIGKYNPSLRVLVRIVERLNGMDVVKRAIPSLGFKIKGITIVLGKKRVVWKFACDIAFSWANIGFVVPGRPQEGQDHPFTSCGFIFRSLFSEYFFDRIANVHFPSPK